MIKRDRSEAAINISQPKTIIESNFRIQKAQKNLENMSNNDNFNKLRSKYDKFKDFKSYENTSNNRSNENDINYVFIPNDNNDYQTEIRNITSELDKLNLQLKKNLSEENNDSNS